MTVTRRGPGDVSAGSEGENLLSNSPRRRRVFSMPMRSLTFLLALCCSLGFAASASAADYAGAISAYRRAHGLPAVQSDSRLNAVALKQAQAS
jgi:hypothetical protein